MKIIEEEIVVFDGFGRLRKRIRKVFFTAISSPSGPLRRAGIGGVRLFCIQIICNLSCGTEHYYETL